MIKPKSKELSKWQDRLEGNKIRYGENLSLMHQRDNIYNGTKKTDTGKKDTATVYNVVYELIESQVDSTIPAPMVTPRSETDIELAQTIEDMIRAKVNQLPLEELNDMDERTTYNQGGDFMLVEWDNNVRTHTSIGDLKLSVIHPLQVIPQDGVTALEDMDYVFIQSAVTRETIRRRYGVEIAESETDPSIRGEDKGPADDLLTLNVAFYRSGKGIGKFVWVDDVELESNPDYQARQLDRCDKCGKVWTGKTCVCGSNKHSKVNEEYEEITEPIQLSNGTVIPPEMPKMDEDGPVEKYVTNPDGTMQVDETGRPIIVPVMEKTKIPFYKPDVFPVVLRKNVSKFGSLLGSSDTDVIRTLQDGIKKLMNNVSEKLLKGGSFVTLPMEVKVDTTNNQLKILRLNSPQEKEMIDVLNLQPNINFDMNAISDFYNKAKSTLGVTDSFQGKSDKTAISGKAKEVAAVQSAGRLDSKRMMKSAFYQKIYEIMFKFMLAYSDEPMEYKTYDEQGNEVFRIFNRYDFLKIDDAGEFYWDDNFLFGVDATGGLMQNRSTLWSSVDEKFMSGAMGDPNDVNTKINYWNIMEQLQYPLAKKVKKSLEAQKEQQDQMQEMAMQQAALQEQMAQGLGQPNGDPASGEMGDSPGDVRRV